MGGGGWLRASLGRNNNGKDHSDGAAISINNISSGGRVGVFESGWLGSISKRDPPIRRNLQSDFSRSGGSHTGVGQRPSYAEVNSPEKRMGGQELRRDDDLHQGIKLRKERERCGTVRVNSGMLMMNCARRTGNVRGKRTCMDHATSVLNKEGITKDAEGLVVTRRKGSKEHMSGK